MSIVFYDFFCHFLLVNPLTPPSLTSTNSFDIYIYIYIMTPEKRVIKIVYPRVHMFSMDLSLFNGNMKSGSLGCSIWDYPIKIIVTTSPSDTITGDLSYLHDKIRTIIDSFRRQENIFNQTYLVQIQSPPEVREHIGVGVTTQILAGTIEALYEFNQKTFDIDKLLLFNVGRSSACSAQLSLHPGFILEQGYNINNTGVCLHPDLYSWKENFEKHYYSFDQCDWFLVLAIPTNSISLSGQLEKTFWKQFYPNNNIDALKICYMVFQELMPAIYTKNFPRFITAMRQITNNSSKRAEEHIQNRITKKCLTSMRRRFGFATISSLGPTIYAFSPTKDCFIPKNNADYFFIKMQLNKGAKIDENK